MPHIEPFLKASVYPAIAAVLLFPPPKCNHVMENDVCTALAENNRPLLQKAVNAFLRKLPPQNNDQQNFERISHWIAGFDCVEAVENSPALLDSYPPVKQFIITLKGVKQPATIGILLQKDHWTFNI